MGEFSLSHIIVLFLIVVLPIFVIFALLKLTMSSSNKAKSNLDELQQLHDLKSKGILTEEEFEREKSKFLKNT